MKNIISILLIIASVALVFLLIKPTYSSINEKKATLEQNRQTLEKADKVKNDLKRTQDKIDAIPADKREKLDKMIPDNINNVNLIIDISNIAQAVNLSITDINVEQTEVEEKTQSKTDVSPDPYQSIDINFKIKARYEEFKTLLRALEKSLRIVDIVKIEFSSASSDSAEASDLYTFDVVLRTYWLK